VPSVLIFRDGVGDEEGDELVREDVEVVDVMVVEVVVAEEEPVVVVEVIVVVDEIFALPMA